MKVIKRITYEKVLKHLALITFIQIIDYNHQINNSITDS